MNLKTTLVLLVFAFAGAVLLYLGVGAGPWLTLTTTALVVPTSDTLRFLEDELTAEQLNSIEVHQGDQVVQLQRGNDGTWSLPGKWPTRQAEVKQLVGLLTGLRSRFEPIAVGKDTDLKEYGLDKPAVTVTVRAGKREARLAFGEAADAPRTDEDEPGDHSRFARPTYLRVALNDGDKFVEGADIVRLAPGLVAALDRPVDYYQQRRLFPGERLAKEGDSQEKEERLSAKSLTIKETKPGGSTYTLNRAGDEWDLAAPLRDRVDPDKLKTILTAVPDLWAEQFVQKPKKDLAEYGLDKPEQTVQVTLADGSARTLLIGKPSQTKVRFVMRPSPPGMPVPPQRQAVHDEYRYAKLQDNDQVFEVRAEHFKDLFVSLDTLRDARLARFRAGDATRLEIEQPGQKPIILVKDRDHWRLKEPLDADAESSKVTELLDKLSALEARDKDILDKADARQYGLDKPAATLKVTVEETASGARQPSDADARDRKKVTKTFALALGKHDAAAKKLYVQAIGWPRLNAVEDALLALVQRPALAYRGRRVLDFLADDLDSIKVQRGGETLALKQADGKWRLAEPVAADADASKASQLADDLGRLEAVEYVSESAKGADLEKLYGLGKPAVSATVAFRDAKKPAQTLLVGKQRPNKQEYFAKLAGPDSVFAVKKEIRDALDQDSLAYRPLQLPALSLEEIADLRVQKEGADEYRLTHKDGGWKIAAPFEAAAMAGTVQPMADELANLKAERYEAHAAKELGKYGLDKPHLRLTLTLTPKKDDKGKETARQRVLLVGKPAEKDPSTRYAKLADGDAIFVVGDKLVSTVDRSALDLLDPQLLTVARDTIERLRSQAGEAKLALQRDKDGWKVVESPAPPFAADHAAVDAVLGVWAGLRAERFAAYGPRADLAKYGLDKPAAIVTVSMQKPAAAEHVLELGKPVEGASGARYARLDKGPGIVVLAAPAITELTRTYLDYVNRTMLDFDPATVNSLTRRKGADMLEVAKHDEGWHLVKPVDRQADDATVQELLRELTAKAKKVAAYPAKDLQPFGLDEPAALVTLHLDAGGKKSEKVLKIGKVTDEAADGKPLGDRFAQVEGSQTVVVLPASLTHGLLAGPLGFRNRTVARFVDADRVVLQREQRKVVFTKVDGTWKLTEPLATDAEHAELENLINAVARLRAQDLVAEKPTEAQLKSYGLDKPAVSWRFQSGDKDVLSLQLGRREKGAGRCYGKLEKGDLVFVLDGSLSAKLFGEYRNRTVWNPSLDSAQADRLTYQRGSTSFRLEKVDGGWHVEGKPDLKVKADAVSDALAAIAGLKAERFVVDNGADLKLYGLQAPPELVVEVHTPTGVRVLHVGRPEGESKAYYARVLDKDRTDVFVIGEADAAKIIHDLPAFTQTTKTE